MWVSETRFGNELGYMLGQAEQSPVTVIRDALDQCDDESPALGTSDLNSSLTKNYERTCEMTSGLCTEL